LACSNNFYPNSVRNPWKMTKKLPSGDIEISVSLVGDDKMRELNKEHRGQDLVTDVLAFEIGEKAEDGKYFLGDVVVNKDQAARQADEYGNDLEHEIAELVEHGVLHLLGVEHKEEK